MTVQTRGDLQRLLQEGVDAVAGTAYERWSPIREAFLETKSDNSAYATDVFKSTLGAAQVKTEGAEVATDKSQQLYVNQYNHRAYAIGVDITFESIQDNLYEDEMVEAGMYIEESLQEAEEIVSAGVINGGWSSVGTSLAGDGLSVFNSSHVLKSGTFSNELSVYQSLSEASLEDVCIAISKFKNAAGNRANIMSECLVVPSDLMFVADRLLASSFQPETGNNAINSVTKKFAKGYEASPYFTDTGAWFVKTNVKNGGKFYRRNDHMFMTDNANTNTMNYRHIGYTRFSVGVTDPRAYFGSGSSS